METVIITRHAALVALLIERGIIQDGTPVLAHATPEEVRGRHIIGVLPLCLAAEAAMVTEIPLSLSPEDRGKELTIERLREIAGQPRTYQVREIVAGRQESLCIGEAKLAELRRTGLVRKEAQ